MSIKTEAHAREIAERIKTLGLKIFICDPKDFDYALCDNGREEGDGWSVEFNFCGVDIGWPVELETIVGDKVVSGYRIYTMQHSHATRWEPEDAWDVTVAEAQHPQPIIEQVLNIYLNTRLAQIVEAETPYNEEN